EGGVVKARKPVPFPPEGVCGPLLFLDQGRRQHSRDPSDDRIHRRAALTHEFSCLDLIALGFLGREVERGLARRTRQYPQQRALQTRSPSGRFTTSATT